MLGYNRRHLFIALATILCIAGKGLFEKKLGKIAKAKPQRKPATR